MPGQAQTIITMLTETQVPVPKNLAAALEAFEAAATEPPAPVDVFEACQTVTADGVPDLIQTLVEHQVLKSNWLSSGTYEQVSGLLDKRVSGAFVNDPVIGKVFTAYGEQFAEQAELLTEAAPRLPAVLELSRAANGSPDGLAAWAIARDACATLEHLKNRRELLADWGLRNRTIDSDLERATRFTQFDDREAIDLVNYAEKVAPFFQWVSIARVPGATLHWSTLDEQSALAAKWKAEDEAAERAQVERARAEGEAEAARWVRPTEGQQDAA